MDIGLVVMPKHQARKAFVEYREAVRERHSAEDEAIMRCYRALSQGKQVVNIQDAMRQAGEDSQGLPRLAVMRADQERAFLDRFDDGRLHFKPESGSWGSQARTVNFHFPRGTLSFRGPESWQYSEWQSIAPVIPPALRPQPKLSNYVLLWEAEWQPVQQPAVAPRDPALLKHLGGSLYAVLATWDLTDVERMVLGMTRG